MSLRRVVGWAPLLLLAAACSCGRGGCHGPGATAGGGERVPPALEESSAAPGRRGAGRAEPAPPTAAGRVVRVRDGDSIVVLREGAGVEVRLEGIDCPELGQAYGVRARRFTSELAFGREVRLAVTGRDDYARELAEVFLPDGRSLNRELVAAGFAWWFRRHSSDEDLQALERQARAGRRGLWADPEPVPPWEFRKKNRR